jgi:hypothetical protein
MTVEPAHRSLDDIVQHLESAFATAVPILSQLLKAEMAEREVRSIAYQMKAARLPAYKDLAGFDFAASEVNETMERQLHRCDFIDGAHNVVAVGGPGTGKTHIATALGVQAVEHHRKKVRFFSTVDLVNALEQEKAQNKAGQLAERLLRLDLIILDELGYLPFIPCRVERDSCLPPRLQSPAINDTIRLWWPGGEAGQEAHGFASANLGITRSHLVDRGLNVVEDPAARNATQNPERPKIPLASAHRTASRGSAADRL